MFNNPVRKRSYAILLGVDYSNATPTMQFDVNSIRNNLLGKQVSDGTWIKFENLPSIRVSTVDIAENRDDIKKMLTQKNYDVVITDRRVGGSNILAGALTSFREVAPNALFVSLLSKSQKRGATYEEMGGHLKVRPGDGVSRLFEKGFYNAIWRDDENFSMEALINLILKNGRTKEEAHEYYGLGITDDALFLLEQKLNGRTELPYHEEAMSVNSTGPAGTDTAAPVNTPSEQAVTKEPPKRKVTSFQVVDDNTPEEVPDYTRLQNQGTVHEGSARETQTAETNAYENVNKQREQSARVAESVEESIQNGIAKTGILQGHVAFASGNIITVQLDHTIESQGIQLKDLLGMPTNTFYFKNV